MENYLRDFCKVIKDNIYTILTGRFIEGETDLNTLGNFALMRMDRNMVSPSLKGVPKLSKKQKKEIKKIYGPYIRFMSNRFHRIYTHESGGVFQPEYMPEDIFLMDIDRYYSNRQEARYLDNKCYYYRMFPNINQPDLIVMRIGKCWLDKGHNMINHKQVLDILSRETSIVVKRAVNSECGAGVTFLSGDTIISKFKKLIKTIPSDVVIQRPVLQHESLAKLHPESVNTLRIVSLLTENKVKIYGIMLRIGAGKSKVDNSSSGGVICSVDKDGNLGTFGNMHDGRRVITHPELGYDFSSQKIEGIDSAIRLVKAAHAGLGHFRIVAWDVAIDENKEAVMIEANLSLGGINSMQVCTGSLFGKDTSKILEEVYGGRRRKWTTLL